MNNLVHIPMTPAAHRERKKRDRERQAGGERETEEGKIKAWGKVRDEHRGEKEEKRKERRKKGEMIANVCQGITCLNNKTEPGL